MEDQYFYQNILLPAVDPHVHVEQIHEGDDASSEEACPVDVVVHVVWINSKSKSDFFLHFLRKPFSSFALTEVLLHYTQLRSLLCWSGCLLEGSTHV